MSTENADVVIAAFIILIVIAFSVGFVVGTVMLHRAAISRAAAQTRDFREGGVRLHQKVR